MDAEEQKLTAAERLKQSDRMGTERIGKLMAEFAIPCILAMVLSSLYNLVDAAFLGIALPDGSGVAVTTLAWPIMCILNGFSMLAGQGGSALGAIQLGEGNKDHVEITLGNTALLLFLISAIVGIIGVVFIDPVLMFIGTSEELWAKTKAFLQIICIFFAFQSLGFGLNQFVRTAGAPNFATASSVFGTFACIFFNWLFVLQFGWGIEGSAWANVTGYGLAMLPVLWFFCLNRKSAFHLHWRNVLPRPRVMGRILVMGLASLAMQLGMAAVGVVFNQVVGIWAADDPVGITGALAALGVANRALSVAFTFIIGLSMGVQPLIGYNYGAQNWDRVIKLFKWACISGAAIGFVFFAASHLFPYQIVQLFGITGNQLDFGVWGLQVYSIWITFIGYQAVASSFFQSSGQPIKSTILELTRQLIILVPLYLFAPPYLMAWFGITGLQAVTFCTPISDAAATIITTVFVIREARKLCRLRREAQQENIKQLEQA